MALIDCHECGHQVSDQAAACPQCGAPPPAPAVGTPQILPPPVESKRFGPGTKIFLGVAALVGIVIALGWSRSTPETDAAWAKRERVKEACDEMMSDSALGSERRQTRALCDQMKAQAQGELDAARRAATYRTNPDPATYAAGLAVGERAAAAKAKRAQACKASSKAKRADYDRLMKIGRYWDASQAVRECATALDDPALKKLADTAEAKYRWLIASDRAASVADRDRALDALERDFPEEAKIHAEKISSLRKEIKSAGR